MAKQTTPAKKSATTELVLGQAAQNITKAVTELNTAITSVNKLGELVEGLSLQVANKEEAIVALDVQYAEKERQLQVELDVNFKENTDRVVSAYLTEVGKVAILKSDYLSLQKELADTKAGAETETKKQVAIVSSSMKSQHENEIKLIHSENQNKTIENSAKIGALGEKNTFLEQQVTKLYLQLDAERAAGIERAKAGSVGSINVSSDRK